MMCWEDENGKEIETCQQRFHLVFDMMSLISQELLNETKCLQFIDPYGDTTFNQAQIPILVRELESTLENCPESKRKEFEEFIGFIKKTEGETHTYIKFWGD